MTPTPPCDGLKRVATLDDLVERDKKHDCGGFGAPRICVRVEAVADLFERLDLQAATLVVHDWGGPIGLRVAVERPERVARMVMLDTANPSVLSYVRTAPPGHHNIVVSVNMTSQPQKIALDLKEAGNFLYLLGQTRDEMGGSHYHLVRGLSGGAVPRPDLERAPGLFAQLHAAIRQGLVRACHDLSEGGLAAALAEMAFAGGIGADVTSSGAAISAAMSRSPVIG